MFRTLLPLSKKVLTSNVTKNIARSAGKTLKNAAVGTALDLLDGQSLQDSARKRLTTTKRKIAKAVRKQAIQELDKKRKQVKPLHKRLKKKRDYFLLN